MGARNERKKEAKERDVSNGIVRCYCGRIENLPALSCDVGEVKDPEDFGDLGEVGEFPPSLLDVRRARTDTVPSALFFSYFV